MQRAISKFRQLVSSAPAIHRQAPSSLQLSTVAQSSPALRSSSQDLPAGITPLPPLQSWCGADVDAVVHKSFEDMIPTEIIQLSGRVFNAPIRPDLVHRTVIWQLAKRRQGTAKTKGRGEVKGSTRKIRPQKGTGRSRQGAITSPIFRGGGVVHGPVPRSYDYPLPMNVRRNALRAVLTSKLQCGQLWIVEHARIESSKTKDVVDACDRYGWTSALIIDDDPDGISGVDPTLHVASHNIRNTLAMNWLGLNVYDALSFDMLVLTRPAVRQLTERFARYGWMF